MTPSQPAPDSEPAGTTPQSWPMMPPDATSPNAVPPSQPYPVYAPSQSGITAPPVPSWQTAPPVYPPPSGVLMPPPAPPTRAQRNMRTLGLGLAALIVLLIVFATFPSAMAGSVRNAYPTVHALITGVRDGSSITVGQTVTFSAAQSTGNSLKYFWDFGDGTTSAQETVQKSFSSSSQQQTISLEVSDPLGSSGQAGHDATTSITIQVTPPQPTASFTFSVGGYDGTGIPVSFDASASTGENLQYQWDFGDGTTDNNGPMDSHDYSQPGTYNVTLTVTDDFGQSNATSQAVRVTVAGPVAKFTASIDSFGDLSVNASASTGDITDYFWNFGDGNTDDSGTSPQDSHTYATNGTYTVTLTITDAFGRKSSTSRSVTY
jgi:PKD repeat protein